MVDQIQTGSSTTTIAATATVSIAETLRGPWIVQPHLYAERVRFACAPEIGDAILSYQYGRQIPLAGGALASLPPRWLNGFYVKIELSTGESTDRRVWYGILQLDERDVHGSVLPNQPKGNQTLTAYELTHILWQTIIGTAVLEIDGSPATHLEIPRGLTFNGHPGSEFHERGNRTSALFDHDGTETTYLFTDEPRGQALWTAQQAIEYLLWWHAPQFFGNVGNQRSNWQLEVDGGDTTLLARTPFNVDTDRRRLWDVLNELIDRRRGAGWYLEFDETRETFLVKAFSFADLPVQDADGNTVLPANTQQKKLDFEQAFDIEQAVIRYHHGQEYDRVIVEGERETTTCTISLANSGDAFIPDWSNDDEADFQNAASQETGYDALDPDEQYRKNEAWRKQDRLAHVYARFRLPDDWNQQVNGFWVATLSDALREYHAVDSPTGAPLWTQGITFESRLPLRAELDYSGNAIAAGTWEAPDKPDTPYLPPLVFVSIGSEWDFIDKLSATEDDEPRGWCCHVRVSERGPILELRVSNGLQQLIAADEFNASGATDPEQLPENRQGLDYKDFVATVCIPLDRRVSETVEIRTVPAGQPVRELRLQIPGARLDYVLWGTAVGVDADRSLQRSNGGYLRDDRAELRRLAALAAHWYGRRRTALEIELKQMTELVQLGWLIINIGETYNPPPPDEFNLLTTAIPSSLFAVNTPITAITYDLRKQTQRIETAYAELDLSR